MDILDEDFIDLQSQVRVIESDLQASLNKIDVQIDEVRNTKTESSPAQTTDVDEKLVSVSKKISDLENKVSLE